MAAKLGFTDLRVFHSTERSSVRISSANTFNSYKKKKPSSLNLINNMAKEHQDFTFTVKFFNCDGVSMLSSNGVSSFSSVFGKEHTRARFEHSWISKDTLVDYINEKMKQYT